jgi:toxin ParE1/3/4
MRVRWTPDAARDLELISKHIAETNPAAALRIVRAIYRSIEMLGAFPRRGRTGREAGTRELVLAPLRYVVVYRIKEEQVQILRIYHGAQERPTS